MQRVFCSISGLPETAIKFYFKWWTKQKPKQPKQQTCGKPTWLPNLALRTCNWQYLLLCAMISVCEDAFPPSSPVLCYFQSSAHAGLPAATAFEVSGRLQSMGGLLLMKSSPAPQLDVIFPWLWRMTTLVLQRGGSLSHWDWQAKVLSNLMDLKHLLF